VAFDEDVMALSANHRVLVGLSRNTFLLAAASLFADISTEMLYPILPIFLAQNLSVSGGLIGLLEGIAGATQNITQGFSGWLSDRLRQRKRIALVGYALAAIAKPLIGISTVWQGVLGARFLDRLGSGLRSAPRDALVGESAEEKYRGRAFGLEGAGDNAGAFLGPLIAVALLAWGIGLSNIFLLAFIPGLLAFLMILLVKEKPARPSSGAPARRALPVAFPRPYRAYLAATAVFGLGNFSSAFLILKTQELGASIEQTVLIYAAFNLVAALASYPAGALSDRFGRRNLLATAFVVFVLCYSGFAFSEDIFVVAALFVLYGVFQGVFRSVGKALANDLAPDAARASAVGWYGATVGLSGLLAGIVAGLLWDHAGHVSLFLYGAGFGLAGLVALVFLVRNAQPERPT